MPLLEKEIEDALFEQGFIEHNGDIISWIGTQIPINGFYIDMMGVSEDCSTLYVVEIKKGEVDGNALSQIINYMHIVREFINVNPIDIKTVKGILVGTHLSSHMQLAIAPLKSSLCFMRYTPSISLHEKVWNMREDVLKSEETKSQVEHISNLVNTVVAESDESDE